VSQIVKWKPLLFLFLFLSFAAGQAEVALQDVAETSLLTIRAELPASVEKSGVAAHQTNVALNLQHWIVDDRQ
jgi:hypothetical protein